MKKLIFLTLLIAMVAFPTKAQETPQQVFQTFVSELSNEIDAFEITVPDGLEGADEFVAGLQVPSFYTNSLITSEVNRIVRSYSDLRYAVTWRQSGDNINSAIQYDGINEYIMVLVFSESTHLLMLSYTKY